MLVDWTSLPIILAHTAPGSGAMAGFLHPILGGSHLIAMVTVGLLSASLGGRAIWTVPAAFLATMTIGGIVGVLRVPLPFTDLFIAASIVVLGVLLLARTKLPEWAAMLTVGVFGIFHGYAHGTNLPETNDVMIIVAYIVGFLVSTAGLHVIGALIGYIALRNQRGLTVLRVSGVLIAAAGVLFLGQL